MRLLDDAMIRVGNDEYARDNHSFGLTTIRNHHVDVRGSNVQFCFKGKSGRKCEAAVTDPRVAKVIRKCQDLPGQELFEYIDEQGGRHDVGSGDVNDYLMRISGQRFTAKDFRTWAGTVAAAQTLCRNGSAPKHWQRVAKSKRLTDRAANEAVRAAAEALGNTLATCRKFYVHPRLLEPAGQITLAECFAKAGQRLSPARLKAPERAVLRFVRAMNGT